MQANHRMRSETLTLCCADGLQALRRFLAWYRPAAQQHVRSAFARVTSALGRERAIEKAQDASRQ